MVVAGAPPSLTSFRASSLSSRPKKLPLSRHKLQQHAALDSRPSRLNINEAQLRLCFNPDKSDVCSWYQNELKKTCDTWTTELQVKPIQKRRYTCHALHERSENSTDDGVTMQPEQVLSLDSQGSFDPLNKGNGNLSYYMSAKGAKTERLEADELGILVKNFTKRASIWQIASKVKDNTTLLVRTASVAATAFTALACYQAWAGPEIASVQDAASWFRDLDDIKSGFVSAFLLIFFSEIGDKTFFIAAVLASRKSTAAVFTGTFGALVAMTFISVFLGRTFHYIDGILPFSLGETELPLDDLAAVVLLVYFGATTLFEAASTEGSKAEEEQQEAELAIAGLGPNGKGLTIKNTALATFGLVFVAEWGDKSFFSTVALSAASSPVGVVSGAVAGHGLATLLAVVGGSFLSSYISEKVTGYIGGSLFLVFAAFTLFEIFS